MATNFVFGDLLLAKISLLPSLPVLQRKSFEWGLSPPGERVRQCALCARNLPKRVLHWYYGGAGRFFGGAANPPFRQHTAALRVVPVMRDVVDGEEGSRKERERPSGGSGRPPMLRQVPRCPRGLALRHPPRTGPRGLRDSPGGRRCRDRDQALRLGPPPQPCPPRHWRLRRAATGGGGRPTPAPERAGDPARRGGGGRERSVSGRGSTRRRSRRGTPPPTLRRAGPARGALGDPAPSLPRRGGTSPRGLHLGAGEGGHARRGRVIPFRQQRPSFRLNDARGGRGDLAAQESNLHSSIAGLPGYRIVREARFVFPETSGG